MQTPTVDLAAACLHHAYSRKQKSLSLLCSNFVSLYNRDDVETVGLDDAARRLGVERRRIYDIVNVLESVGILIRKAKNRYNWIGFSGIPKALERLKEHSTKGVVSSQGEESGLNNISDDDDDDTDQCKDGDSEKLTPTINLSQSSQTSSRSRDQNRKEKSLGLLTQNFVKLFLNSDVDTVSLDDAARLLLGDSKESNMRTKVRRLYDIANVLSSLNLIEKTQQMDTRKPAFRWLGSSSKPREMNVDTAASVTKTRMLSSKRSFGTDITNLNAKRSKNPMEMKPRELIPRSEISKEYSSTMLRQAHCTKGDFVFGPFRPAGTRESDGLSQVGKGEDRIRDWESLAAEFRPVYQNQALGDLFAHYVEAWRSWYSEFAHGSSAVSR